MKKPFVTINPVIHIKGEKVSKKKLAEYSKLLRLEVLMYLKHRCKANAPIAAMQFFLEMSKAHTDTKESK